MAKNDKNPPANVIYGIHAVIEALQAGQSVEKVLIRTDNRHDRLRELRSLAEEVRVPLQYVPVERLDRLTRGANHQGAAAQLATITYQDLEPLILAVQERGEVPLLVMLDGVTDVRNFGAIARTAECMGAHGLIVPLRGAAGVNGEAIRASAGALHHLPVCREANLVDSLLLMQAYGIHSVGVTEKTEQTLFDLDLTQPTCLILGAEDKGISAPLLRRAGQLARIPMQGQVSSLNVSVAAGMALLETARQRG
ncbi:MAG: 23S rRNA (guanosine(2251)-2'-O)-methyltransferase RlmB [Bacteroidetes bacterium]|nr:MAG: 23S rRNA (guanosine(2251)-2'-O)-methyltransferase RlmB [Bacteroidota bacterium]